MCEVFNGLRYVIKTGIPWRSMPNDLSPWVAVYQQVIRWLKAGCFNVLAHDLRALVAAGRPPEPTAALLDSRTLCSTPESGHRAGYAGAKRKKGSDLHLAADTLGHLLVLHVMPATADDRAGVNRLVAAVQEALGESVELAFVDQGYTGQKPAAAAKQHGITLEVVRLPQVKRGFVLLPMRWVVERSFAWARKCRCLVKDYERLHTTLEGLHIVAFACIRCRQAVKVAQVHKRF